MLNVAKNEIYNMLFEQEDKKISIPSIPNTIVSSFRGAPRKDLRLADPKEVFKKLGVKTSFTGETAADAVYNLINAVKRNETIKTAYGDLTMVQDDKGKKGALIAFKQLDPKNGTQYMRILLINAIAVGALRTADDLRVQHVAGYALVYPTKGGKPSWSGPVKPAGKKEEAV